MKEVGLHHFRPDHLVQDNQAVDTRLPHVAHGTVVALPTQTEVFKILDGYENKIKDRNIFFKIKMEKN